MSTYVDCESAALDEAFVAVAPGANVGTVIGMYAKVPDEVGFTIELLQDCGEQVSTRNGLIMSWTPGELNSYLWTGWPSAGEFLGMLKGDRGSPISSHVSRQSGEGMGCRKVSAVKADSVDG